MAVNAGQPIVLVDDNPDDLFILKHLLTKAGVKNAILSFERADEARHFLDAALRTPETHLVPAMIFSDLEMPQVNGFDFLAWVRSQSSLKKLPFVLLSGVLLPDDEVRAKELGATRFLEKFPPISPLLKLLG